MFNVYLVNFTTKIYQGVSLDEAKVAAIKSGFECALVGDDFMEVWSPIGGWRKIY
jgi:hypothetical protein